MSLSRDSGYGDDVRLPQDPSGDGGAAFLVAVFIVVAVLYLMLAGRGR